MAVSVESILTLISTRFGENAARHSDIPSYPPCLIIEKDKLYDVCRMLRDNPETDFDMLSNISGIDNFPGSRSMEIIYNLASIPLENQLSLRVILDRPELPAMPEIDSLASIWKSANWLERETYDLLGIYFKGHPDMRRILLPDDWSGHPLRKDYKTDEYYHHVKIDY